MDIVEGWEEEEGIVDIVPISFCNCCSYHNHLGDTEDIPNHCSLGTEEEEEEGAFAHTNQDLLEVEVVEELAFCLLTF